MINNDVIEVRELTKRFGDVIAVNQINFSINQGEIFGFLGPNGAGKTTTIRMLTGLLTPDPGDVFIDGHKKRSNPSKNENGSHPRNGEYLRGFNGKTEYHPGRQVLRNI